VSPVVIGVAGLFVLGYGAVAIFAVRHRHLGRLAIREAARRKGQTLLVVTGLMVGTAAITAAMVAADSVDATSFDLAVRNWGFVDLTVTSGSGFFPPDVAARLAAAPAVGRVTDGVAPGIDLAASVSDLDTRQGATISLVGFDPRFQAPFGAYVLTTGRRTTGRDLSAGGVLLSQVLADKLGARPGDRLRVRVGAAGLAGTAGGTAGAAAGPAGGAAADLRVAGIAREQGPGGYTLGPVVFAPLSTAQRITGTNLVNVVWISAHGGIGDSLVAAHRAAPVIRDAVAALRSPVPLQVQDAKAREVGNARTGSLIFRSMLLGMSALVVAVGGGLIVNLMGMLAEERRSRLGVLRALGLNRARLAGLSVTEGALYSLVAGAAGTAAGAAAGRLVAARFGDVFAAYSGPDSYSRLSFALKGPTLVTAFSVGAVLALAIIFAASRRTARMTVAAAIRDLPEPAAGRTARRWPRRVRLASCAVIGCAALFPPYFPRLAGGILLVLTAAALAGPRLSPRAHATLTGLALAGWSLAMIGTAEAGADPSAFILVFVAATLTSVFGLTILAAANLQIAETAAGLMGSASGGLRAILRPPLAYLSRRPVRTGLSTGMFAVVVAMLTLFAVFYVIDRPDYQQFGNGYDVQIQSAGSAVIRLPETVRADVTRSVSLPTRGYTGAVTSSDAFSSGVRMSVPLLQVSRGVAGHPPVRLAARDSRFRTDGAAWAAVIRDPSLVISDLGAPGQQLTLQGSHGPVTFTIVGSQPSGLLDGVFGTARALAPFRAAPLGATMLLGIRDPAQAGTVARTVQRLSSGRGVAAVSVRALLDQAYRANRALLLVIDVLMRMGLVVGILGLGIVAMRVVAERRPVIGILRAIGYKRRSIILGLLSESAVSATIGAGTGIVAGISMGYLFYRQSDFRPGFGVDLASIGGVLGLIYLGVRLVTLGPAWRASRLPPAEAVRRTV
jgi:putative ABC transport system permease protein